MSKINKDLVLSLALGFVVIWFGISEITSPEKWGVYVPDFLSSLGSLKNLVIIHGVVLVLCGIGVIFNFHRRIAAFLIACMIVQIIVTLFIGEGLDELVVRDIGLLGLSLALLVKN